MRKLFFTIALLLPFQLSASCPALKDVVDSLPDIDQALSPHSNMHVIINGVKHKAHREIEDSPAVDDLLSGNFDGFGIERLTETTPGECRYRVKDDRTPVNGVFILKEVK